MDLERLRRPFPENEIKWRVGATNVGNDGKPKWGDKPLGIPLAYIDARAVEDRLDDVCGALWQRRYPDKGLCEIGLKIGSEWVWRANGAGETDFEGEKGQYSDAFKRAAVSWSVGRYLYNLKYEWAPIKKQGKSWALIDTPQLPDWAKPGYTPKMSRDKKREYVEKLTEHLLACDEQGVRELAEELTNEEKLYIWPEFNSAQRALIKDFTK